MQYHLSKPELEQKCDRIKELIKDPNSDLDWAPQRLIDYAQAEMGPIKVCVRHDISTSVPYIVDELLLNKAFFIRSACGTKKTKMLTKLIVTYAKCADIKLQDLKVLFLVSRVTTANSITNSLYCSELLNCLKIKNYLDADVNEKDLFHDANIVIVSLDSISRSAASYKERSEDLMRRGRVAYHPHHLVILDEVSTLLPHFLSKTIIKNNKLLTSFRLFKLFLQNPKTKLVCMDALLDVEEIKVVKSILEEEGGIFPAIEDFSHETSILLNGFRPAGENIKCYYFYDNYYKILEDTVYEKYQLYLKKIANNDYTNIPQVVVASGSVNHILEIREILAKKCEINPEHSVFIYANGNESERSTAKNPDVDWSTKFLIVYSPAIGGAVSYFNKEADITVFCFANTEVGVNFFYQMAFRARCSKYIYMYVAANKKWTDLSAYPMTYEDYQEGLLKTDQFNTEFCDILTYELNKETYQLEVGVDFKNPYVILKTEYGIKENRATVYFYDCFMELLKSVSTSKIGYCDIVSDSQLLQSPQKTMKSKLDAANTLEEIKTKKELVALKDHFENPKFTDKSINSGFTESSKIKNEIGKVFSYYHLKLKSSQFISNSEEATDFFFDFKHIERFNIFQTVCRKQDIDHYLEKALAGDFNFQNTESFKISLVILIIYWLTGIWMHKTKAADVDIDPGYWNVTIDSSRLEDYLDEIYDFFDYCYTIYNIVKNNNTTIPPLPTAIKNKQKPRAGTKITAGNITGRINDFFLKVLFEFIPIKILATHSNGTVVVYAKAPGGTGRFKSTVTRQKRNSFVAKWDNWKELWMVMSLLDIYKCNSSSWKFGGEQASLLEAFFSNRVLNDFKYRHLFKTAILNSLPSLTTEPEIEVTNNDNIINAQNIHKRFIDPLGKRKEMESPHTTETQRKHVYSPGFDEAWKEARRVENAQRQEISAFLSPEEQPKEQPLRKIRRKKKTPRNNEN